MDDAAVLAECAAHPEDDGPRLVWADHVGGERGELVVIQCDLARGNLSPAETAARRVRERELLAANGIAWAGALAGHASRWSFRRGFVEAARLTSFDPVIATEHPLLRSIALGEEHALRLLPKVAPCIALRGLHVPSAVPHLGYLEATSHIEQIRSLALDGMTSQLVALAREVIARAPLEQLWLVDHELDAGEVRALLAAAPRISALAISSRRHGYLADPPRLRALHVDRVDLAALHRSSAATLEHLRVAFETAAQAELLAALPELRTVEIAGVASEAVARALPPNLGALRTLKIAGALYERELRALGDRYGRQLALLELPTGTNTNAFEIAGEVRKIDGVRPAYSRELLHHDPAALLALGAPVVARTPPACLVEATPQGKIWDVGDLPVEETLQIGRNGTCAVQILSTFVSSRHAELRWQEQQHFVRDLGSANGIAVNGRAAPLLPLRDGDELSLGNVHVIYLVGAGARARAVEMRAAAANLDPVTRLPHNPAPSIRILIANWDGLAQHDAATRDAVMREVALFLRGLRVEAALWHVGPGVFGTDSAELARRASVTVHVAHGTTQLDAKVIAQ